MFVQRIIRTMPTSHWLAVRESPYPTPYFNVRGKPLSIFGIVFGSARKGRYCHALGIRLLSSLPFKAQDKGREGHNRGSRDSVWSSNCVALEPVPTRILKEANKTYCNSIVELFAGRLVIFSELLRTPTLQNKAEHCSNFS